VKASTGILTEWSDDRGFGFVTPADAGNKVFVHIGAFAPGTRRPRVGDRLQFDIDASSQKGPRAVRVRFADGDRGSNTPPLALPLALSALYLAALGLGIALDRVPKALLYAVLAWSAISFVAYALDKRAARRDAQRTPENVLHALSLLGGWPGAAMAQQWLRHKSRKPSFRVAYYMTIALHLVVAALLVSPALRRSVLASLGQLVP
jgi:uncharacterized membrane protein YsdA (DUF1294 family)/cold shock CspA family protein